MKSINDTGSITGNFSKQSCKVKYYFNPSSLLRIVLDMYCANDVISLAFMYNRSHSHSEGTPR